MTADQIIEKLALQPHPEGGWYRQTWVSDERLANGRAAGTAILFLLKAGERSHWHRVDADEIWLFHAGAPLTLKVGLEGDKAFESHTLGPDISTGLPQVIVPATRWQAAQSTGDWTLVSCTVSPGFQFDAFELAAPEFDLPEAG